MRIKVTIVPLDNGKYAAVCQTGDCDWSSVHVVKAAAEEEARHHRQTHRVAKLTPMAVPAPVRTAPRLADHRAPLPASVLARCADTAATHCALVGESVWLRCTCGAWRALTPLLGGDTTAVRLRAAELDGWARAAGGEGPWQCPPCAERERRAAA